MKWTKKILLFFICTMSVLEILPIQASLVGYESIRYPFDIHTTGSGIIHVKERSIKGYERLKLEQGESITLSIKADDGSRIDSIQYNGLYLQNNNVSKITHIQGNTPASLTVVFVKETIQEPTKPVIPPINPPTLPSVRPPMNPIEQPEKEIVADTIITKDIPMDAFTKGITDDFLRKYIQSSRDYVILSHNVKAKPGTYTILIELDNGSQKEIQINVVDGNKISPSVSKPNKDYSVIIVALLLAYSIYMHVKIKKIA